MEKDKKLTSRQRKWLRAFLDINRPETFFDKKAAARAAGYFCEQESYESIGSHNIKKLQKYINGWLEEFITKKELEERLVDGLDAIKTIYFPHEGNVVDKREVIDWKTRRIYLDMAIRLRGLYAPQRFEVILQDKGGATPEEKQQSGD